MCAGEVLPLDTPSMVLSTPPPREAPRLLPPPPPPRLAPLTLPRLAVRLLSLYSWTIRSCSRITTRFWTSIARETSARRAVLDTNSSRCKTYLIRNHNARVNGIQTFSWRSLARPPNECVSISLPIPSRLWLRFNSSKRIKFSSSFVTSPRRL